MWKRLSVLTVPITETRLETLVSQKLILSYGAQLGRPDFLGRVFGREDPGCGNRGIWPKKAGFFR